MLKRYRKALIHAGIAASASVALGLAGCTGGANGGVLPASTRTTFGPAVNVGNGTAHSYVSRDGSGNLDAVGVNFTAAALTGLPNADTAFTMPLPANAAVAPYNHIEMDWEPFGHPPAGIYDKAHFDFHFYMVTPQQQAQIQPAAPNAAANPAPQFVAPGYILDPTRTVVPHMGLHFLDTNAPEFHGKPFTMTFIYGYFQGNMVFLEPMVALDFLKSRATSRAAIAQPAAFQRHGFYPTQYGVSFDSLSQSYNFEVSALRPH
jgi:hypothetical protein